MLTRSQHRPPLINNPIGDSNYGYKHKFPIQKRGNWKTRWYHSDNIKLYGADDEEYFESLKGSIRDNGLKNPILIYPDTNKIKSGHARTRACNSLGYTHIPYTYSISDVPSSEYENMMSLQMDVLLYLQYFKSIRIR